MQSQTRLYFDTLDNLKPIIVMKHWFDFDNECGQIAISQGCESVYVIFSCSGSFIHWNGGQEQKIESNDSVNRFLENQFCE